MAPQGMRACRPHSGMRDQIEVCGRQRAREEAGRGSNRKLRCHRNRGSALAAARGYAKKAMPRWKR